MLVSRSRRVFDTDVPIGPRSPIPYLSRAAICGERGLSCAWLAFLTLTGRSPGPGLVELFEFATDRRLEAGAPDQRRDRLNGDAKRGWRRLAAGRRASGVVPRVISRPPVRARTP